MWLIAKEKGQVERELIAEWTHIAKCVGVVDLWTQLVTFNKKEKEVHQVMFTFELLNETYTYEDDWEEKTWTRTMSRSFTISLSKKATLRKFLESWRWKKFTEEELKGFNLWKVLWIDCQVQVLHSEDGQYANIENVFPMMKWVQTPESQRELVLFSIDENEKWEPEDFDEKVFDSLPEWIRNKISDSKEMRILRWEISLDEQEKEIEKEIEEKKSKATEVEQPTQSDAEDIFNEKPKAESKPTESKEVDDDPFAK